MAGRTLYHMTPKGLMRCRHGYGGKSGQPRACPYGGPVISSSERMALPKQERPPVLKPGGAAQSPAPNKIVGKEEARRAELVADFRKVRSESSEEEGSGYEHFSRTVQNWIQRHNVAYYNIDGLTAVEVRVVGHSMEIVDEFYTVARGFPAERLPEVMTGSEIVPFLEEARKELPQTEAELLATLPTTPYWEDTSGVDEEALLKKFRNKTSRSKELLTEAEVYWLASQSSSPMAKGIMAKFEEAKPRLAENALQIFRRGGYIGRWKMHLHGLRHRFPYQGVKPAAAWGLLSEEMKWKLIADGVDVPTY